MQTVSDSFKNMVAKPIIPIDWGFKMSPTKQFEPDINWFYLDSSVLDGIDILKPSDDNPLQNWFKFIFENYDSRVMSLEWEREIDFPYSVQSALADITLRNTDGYFTPGGSSPIQEYILPKRPIIIYQGFKTVENLGQFVGLTQEMPQVTTTTAAFHALDFLSEMYEIPLAETVAMRDVRTDEVLEVILQQLGLVPSQYNLARGRNIIPFLFFERGITAGTALRQLMQAEMGLLWLDEQGIFRFTPRIELEEAAVFALDDKNVISIQVSPEAQIINHIKITTNVREVQSFQSIHTKTASGESTSDLWVVPNSGGTLEQSLSLENPAISAEVPTLGVGSGVSWFTAKDSSGDAVLSNITATGELLNNSYRIIFTNNNAFDVEIDELDLWGEPALPISDDVMTYELQVDESIGKYGKQTLEIENDFIANESNANSLALMILDSYSEYKGVLEVSIKPNPALQLGDILEVDYREYQGNYKIDKITNKLVKTDNGLEYTQVLRIRRYNIRPWFILSNLEAKSLLDSDDVLTP